MSRAPITREQHIETGLALGYPVCCVMAWVDRGHSNTYGIERGSVTQGVRTPEEIAAAPTEHVRECMSLMPTNRYVPCEACMWKLAGAQDPRYKPGTLVEQAREAARHIQLPLYKPGFTQAILEQQEAEIRHSFREAELERARAEGCGCAKSQTQLQAA